MADLPRETIRLTGRAGRQESEISLHPEAKEREALAGALGIRGIRKLRFEGRLVPEGSSDWRLEAKLGATVIQDCVVTLEPVTTRIDEQVTRRYLSRMEDPEGGTEVEIPDDDTIEPLPATLDVVQVMMEALALALPAFPRAEGVEAVEETYADPGAEPITEEKTKPFAGLRDKLEGKDDS